MATEELSSDESFAHSTGSFDKYRRKNYPQLYIDYKDKYGTRNNLYEAHAHIKRDIGLLEEQLLSEDDHKTLEELIEESRLLDLKIEGYSLEIERLQLQCWDEGIIDENDRYIDSDGEVTDGDNGDNNTQSASPGELAMPLLPPEPPTLPAASTTPPFDTLQNLTSWFLNNKLAGLYNEIHADLGQEDRDVSAESPDEGESCSSGGE